MSSNKNQKRAKTIPESKGRNAVQKERKSIGNGKTTTNNSVKEGDPSKVEALEQELLSLKIELKYAQKTIDNQQEEINSLKCQQNTLGGKMVTKTEHTVQSKKLRLNTSQRNQNTLPTALDSSEGEDPSENQTDLKQQVNQLSKKVCEMEQFFTDHGLSWVGDQGNEGDDETEDGEDDIDEDEGEEDTFRLTHTTRTVIPNFERVFSAIDDLNIMATEPQIIHTRSGATFKQCKLLHLNLYSDGMVLENHPFRQYSSLSVQEFFRDIEDGYYPTELKSNHPNGVVFQVIDNRKKTYAETMGFIGKGQKLGGQINQTPPCCLSDAPVEEIAVPPVKRHQKPENVYVYERKFEVSTRKIKPKEGEGGSKVEEENGKKERPSILRKSVYGNNQTNGEAKGENSLKKARISEGAIEKKRKSVDEVSSKLAQNGDQNGEEPPREQRSDFKEIWSNKRPVQKSNLQFNGEPNLNKNDQLQMENSSNFYPQRKTIESPVKIEEVPFENNKFNNSESRRKSGVAENNKTLSNGENNLSGGRTNVSSSSPSSRRKSAEPDVKIEEVTDDTNNTNHAKSRRQSGEADIEIEVPTVRHDTVKTEEPPKRSDLKEETSPSVAVNGETPKNNLKENNKSANGTSPPVAMVSTQTSDHLLVNLPTTTAAGASGSSTVPYNITNINYREGALNINVTAEGLRLLRDETCVRKPEKHTIEKEEMCVHGKMTVDGVEYDCDLDCTCGCQHTVQGCNPCAEPTVERTFDLTEYAHKYKEGALNIEKALKSFQKPSKINRPVIDPSAKYEHFSFLGRPPEEDTNEVKAGEEGSEQKPPKLNEKTSESEILINVRVNNERYLAYIHPNDPMSKILSLLQSKGINVGDAQSKNADTVVSNPELTKEVNVFNGEIKENSPKISEETHNEMIEVEVEDKGTFESPVDNKTNKEVDNKADEAIGDKADGAIGDKAGEAIGDKADEEDDNADEEVDKKADDEDDDKADEEVDKADEDVDSDDEVNDTQPSISKASNL